MSKSTIRQYTIEDIRKLKGQTDWERLAKLTEEEIEAEDPEEDFELDWTTARLVEPLPKQALSIRLDQDLVDFFKASGKGYQTRINAVLRAYVEAQKGIKR